MDKCKEAATPISTSFYLDLDEKGVSIDQTTYRGLIGSLLYLTTSCPDIMFSVCMCVKLLRLEFCQLQARSEEY